MLCDPLWERRRSVLFQWGVEWEGNGSKCMSVRGREGMEEAGPGSGLPDKEGKMHLSVFFPLVAGLCVVLVGMDICSILE